MRVPGQFTRQDVVGTLIPGAVLLLGVAPLLPSDVAVDTLRGATVGLIAAFILGGVLHALAQHVNDVTGMRSAREVFASELSGAEELDDELVGQFYATFRERFAADSLPAERADLTDADCHTVFDLARSRANAEPWVRAHDLETKLEHYGSMWIVTLVLYATYLAYLFAVVADAAGTAAYTSYLSALAVPPLGLFVGLTGLVGAGYVVFKRLRSDYSRLFAKQLMADFVTVETLETG